MQRSNGCQGNLLVNLLMLRIHVAELMSKFRNKAGGERGGGAEGEQVDFAVQQTPNVLM